MTQTYNAGIYCRLSRDDERTGESVSIENQRVLLTRYVQEQGWNLIQTYVDDGVSGTTFDRPGLNAMISDIRAGKINLVIVKDLSRFGRDYIETGKYIDVIFPSLNCRFIALNDGVDTLRHNNEMLAIFKNVMNDFYARDTSSKIKAVKKSTFQAGKFIGAYAPYGYIKDPNDHHHFVIDEPAAAVVRRIFALRCQGISYRRIAGILNEEKVLPPRDYYYQAIGKPNPYRQNHVWNDVTVKVLLRNEAYIGNMVQNKTGTVSYKDHSQVSKPEEDWIRVSNTHEPIIDMDTWELVTQIARRGAFTRVRPFRGINMFAGLLFCLDCGFALIHRVEKEPRKNGTYVEYESYLCGCYSRSGKTACSTHTIYQRPLKEIILADIRAKAELVSIDEKSVVQRLSERMQAQSSQEIAANKKTVKALNKRLTELEKLIAATYEDKVKGLIPESVCIELLNKYQSERNEKAAELKELEQQLDSTQAVQDAVQNWADMIRQYQNLDTLDRETLLRLIDKIEVGEKKIVDGHKEQEIRIHYKFVGFIQ